MKKIGPGAIWLLLLLLSWLPGFILRFFAYLIHFIVFTVIQYRIPVIRDNLNRCFPDKTSQQKEVMEGRFTRHFSELFAEMVIFCRLKPSVSSKRIRLSNPDMLHQAFQNKQNVIILSGHYGNWEWNLLPLLSAGFRILAVYKPQANELADQMMFRIRHKPGITLVPMKDTLRVIKREIDEGKPPFALLLVADQIPARGDIRFWTRFFGHDTAFFTGGEKIAKKFHMPVYYMDQEKKSFASYIATTSILYDGNSIVPDGSITVEFVRLLESTIRKSPHLWLWSHRRWKYRREEVPLPA